MVKISIKEVTVETDEPKEVIWMIHECLAKLADAFAEKPAEKKAKTRSEINHQNYERRKAKLSECQTKSDEEEKEEDSPLIPPSLSPINPLWYPPYNPPFPEEREEDFGGSDGKRGELKSYGPHVRLSDKEFLALQDEFGYEETMRMIRSMNDYIGEDPKLIRKYQTRNHNLTLRNWKRRDAEKKQANEPKKRETWTEVAERVSREMGLT